MLPRLAKTILIFISEHFLANSLHVKVAVIVMTASSSKTVLSLYKTMLRESGKFVDFNYRSYAIRRIKDGFRNSANETDKAKAEQQIKLAKDNLEMIKRQVTIGQLFGLSTKLSLEIPKTSSATQ